MSGAPAAETKPAEAGTPSRKMGKKWKILLILFSLTMMAVLRTGFVFVVIAMLPSIVTYYLDQSKGRFTFKTIFYCNISGLMPFLADLLRYGPGGGNLDAVMNAPSTWIIIYGAAAMGMLLISITPQIARMLIGSLHNTQVSRLQRSQEKILQEWGREVIDFGHTKH